MKRSSQVRLLLLGGFCGGAFTGCNPSAGAGLPPGAQVYPNDYYVNGLGYYHAPYHAWYPYPYNSRNDKSGLYYHGGLWTPEPHASIVNLSEPSPQALNALDSATHVRRGGFGSTGSSGHHFFS